MNYQEAIDYLDSFINYEKIGSYSAKAFFKLERMERLLSGLGNPHRDFPSCHIAGTKGKGSTCAFLYSMLKASGRKAGLYTSPHLTDFRERIRVSARDEEFISKEDVCGLMEEIRPHAEKMRKTTLGELSFFEVYTALAFLYFARERVDCAVVETGLGGRLDATNVVDGKFAAITQISYDHTQQLGNDIASIAAEKSGIIKENATVVSSRQVAAAESAIEDACRKRNARLCTAGKEINYKRTSWGLNGATFDLNGPVAAYKNLCIKLLGAHQVENAATAAALAQLMGLEEEDIRKGLDEAKWPGRLDMISRDPLVILDGAQNAASAGALRAAIKELFPGKKFILVFGVSSDKDAAGIAGELFPFADEVILTRADNPRAADPRHMAAAFKDLLPEKHSLKETVSQAIDEAMERLKRSKASSNGKALLVTGSLYVVGEAMEHLA